MTPSRASIEASYAHCRAVTRRARSSFRLAMLMLPPAKRRAMDALYAFMRHTDDLGDNAAPVAQRRALLDAWRTALEAALQPGPQSAAPSSPAPPQAPTVGCSEERGRLILPALSDTVARFGIPPEHLRAVITGQEMDLAGCRYATFDDLAEYCHLVASAVGLACIHIWGFRGPEAFAPARHCGVALQLTNILRDLRQDAAMGRVYLPEEDLRQAGYTADDLRQGVADARFARLMALEIDRAKHHYREAAQLREFLLPDGRRCFDLMCGVYGRLLTNIAADPAAVFRRRVSLSLVEKAGVVARCLLGRAEVL